MVIQLRSGCLKKMAGKSSGTLLGMDMMSEKDNTNTFQSNDPITIGVPNIGNVGGLLGTIDEIRISNVARTEKEINEMKDVGLAQILSVNPGEKLTTRWGYMKHVP